MNELTREAMLNDLAEEQAALIDFLSPLSDVEWHTLAREDGWSVHDIAAHVADVHLTTVALGGVVPHLTPADVGVTLPMMPSGRVNIERLNMMRYQVNRGLSRDEVLRRLVKAFTLVRKAIKALDDDRFAGPGPYGPAETMREWFNAALLHGQGHRLQLERLYASRV